MGTNTQVPETGSSIPAYQQRVLEEHSALKARNNALLALLQNPKPDAITDRQWQLLNEQYACMESYQDVLEARLVDFGLDSLPDSAPTPEAQPSMDTRMEADINQLGLNAPRVPKEHIDMLMEHVQYKTHIVEGTTTTVAVAVLPMGTVDFTLAIESTACVDKANFNAELGAKYAIEKAAESARNKLWELEGYVLALCIHNNDMALAQSLEPFDPNNTVNS